MAAQAPQSAQPSPDAVRVRDFIDDTHAAGFGAVDPTIIAAAAQGPINHPITANMLGVVKTALADGASQVGHYFSEPTVQQPPSTAQTIADHFYNSGIKPVPTPYIQKVQQAITAHGFGQGLQSDGVWNNDWNNAYYQYTQSQQHKTAFGVVGAREAFNKIVNPSWLATAIPTLEKAAASLPKGIVNAIHSMADPGWNLSNQQIQAANQQLQTNPAAAVKQAAGQALGDVGTLLMASSMVGDAGKITSAWQAAAAAGKTEGAESTIGALTKILPKEAVQRRTTIMNTLLPPMAKDEVANAGRRFAFTKSLQNMPGMNYMNDLATGIHDTWTTARAVAATPYRLPVIGALGSNVGRTSIASMKVAGIVNAEKAIDPNNPDAQILDHVTPIAGREGQILNLLQLGSHAPTFDAFGKPSQEIGKIIGNATDDLAKGLMQTQAIPNFERATGVTYKQAILDAAQAGVKAPEAELNAHILSQINTFAAQHTAQGALQRLQKTGKVLTDDERYNYVTTLSHQIVNDPERLTQARNDYLTVPGLYAADLARTRNNILSNSTKSYSRGLANLLLRNQTMREEIIPKAESLITPETWRKYSDATEPAPWEAGASTFVPKTMLNTQDATTFNQDMPLGSIGHMNIERQTSGDAQAFAMKAYKDLAKVNEDVKAPKGIAPARIVNGVTQVTNTKPWELPQSFDKATATSAELDLRQKVLDYLGHELNRNIKDLQYVPTKNLIDLVVEKSHTLAADVHLPLDAPQELKDAVAKLAEQGSKPVFGTDIGHSYFHTPLPMEQLGQAQSRLSRYASKAGLNFMQVNPNIAARHAYSEMLNTVQDHILTADPGTYPVWATASRMVNYLQDVIKPDMNLFISGEYALAASRASKLVRPIKSGMWENEIKTVMERDSLTRPEAKAAIQKVLTKDTGPQYWTRKQVVDALTKPEIRNKFGDTVEAPDMTMKAANEFYYAMQKGLRSAPAYVEGLNPFNKMLDSTFALGNIPIGRDGKRILDLTSGIRKQLLNFRYQGSYRFAYLRVIKSALKGVTADVPFTTDAAGSLKESGIEAEAMKLRDDYLGKNPEQKAVTDYVAQEYSKADIFNVYNPRAIEARILYYLHHNALDAAGGDVSKINKDQVLKTFDKVYSYGNRTAAEKSVNAFFFPFSFEKTVMRQLGGHLLDEPAARMMTAAAISAYDSPQGQQVKTWMEKNLPLFKEAEKFNPFYHGVGLGQFGGINRLPYEIAKPLLARMLSPQPITTTDSAKAAMAMIPAYRDLANILIGVDPNGKKPTQWGGELWSTLKTGMWEIGDKIAPLVSDQNYANKPFRSYALEPYDVQQTNGWNLRTQYVTHYAQALDDNRHGGNWTWPASIPRVGGKKLSSETINLLVNHVYPKWDAAQMSVAAAKTKAAIGAYREVAQAKGQDYLSLFDRFTTNSDVIQGRLSHDYYADNTGDLVSDTTVMRETAIRLAQQDPRFATFYKQYYASKYGPLEAIK